MESTALIHLGQWRRLQRETIAALTLAERNANRPAIALCRLTLAWLHVEAMDFHGARDLCESVEQAVLEENPFAFFFQRAVAAKAFVGLNEPRRARQPAGRHQRRQVARLVRVNQAQQLTERSVADDERVTDVLGQAETRREVIEDLTVRLASCNQRTRELETALEAARAEACEQAYQAQRLYTTGLAEVLEGVRDDLESVPPDLENALGRIRQQLTREQPRAGPTTRAE